MNAMKEIRIEKLTLNIGAGKDQKLLEKGIKLLKNFTGIAPVKTVTSKRIPTWGLRPGLPVGCKLTIRNEKAVEIAKKLLEAKENILDENNFDKDGNVAFGVHEYIDIPGLEYDPEVGIIGLQACITLERRGYRVKKRRLNRTGVGVKHKITAEEAIGFMKEKFNVTMGE